MKYEEMKGSLDDAWLGHIEKCDRCKQFRADKPATLSIVCLSGAPFIKQILERDAQAKASKKSRTLTKMWRESEEGRHFASNAKVKKLMRYK